MLGVQRSISIRIMPSQKLIPNQGPKVAWACMNEKLCSSKHMAVPKYMPLLVLFQSFTLDTLQSINHFIIWRNDFKMRCWKRLFRIPWAERRSRVDPKGNKPWIFIGRTDTEVEAPILWPPDAKSWLVGKDPNAGKDWGQEEKGATEDEMVGWHHQLNGHKSPKPATTVHYSSSKVLSSWFLCVCFHFLKRARNIRRKM